MKSKLLIVSILVLICSHLWVLSDKSLFNNSPPSKVEEPTITETSKPKREMKILQTEKYSTIYYGDEIEPHHLGIPDEAVNPNGKLVITYLDVGQGDSAFLILPSGETLLIDTGESEKSDFVINYIKTCGINTLDHVVFSHPHSDHIGGGSAILKAFDVKNVYMPNCTHTTDTFENLIDTIAGKGLKITTAKAGKKIIDSLNLQAEFIAPIQDSYDDINNYSAVLMLKYKDNKFLFMGEAYQKIEDEILSSGYDIKADILKVGHHGSETSSSDSFIKAVKPQYSIISCSRNNSYGHPAKLVLDILENNNTEIWRTDLRSTVTAVSDGFNITLNSNYYSIDTNAPPTEEAAELKSNIENAEEKTVYITKTGKKFHNENCSSLAKSKIAISLSEAEKYYVACQKCKP